MVYEVERIQEFVRKYIYVRENDLSRYTPGVHLYNQLFKLVIDVGEVTGQEGGGRGSSSINLSVSQTSGWMDGFEFFPFFFLVI